MKTTNPVLELLRAGFDKLQAHQLFQEACKCGLWYNYTVTPTQHLDDDAVYRVHIYIKGTVEFDKPENRSKCTLAALIAECVLILEPSSTLRFYFTFRPASGKSGYLTKNYEDGLKFILELMDLAIK